MLADCRARRRERRFGKGSWSRAVRWRCVKRGKGGSGGTSLGFGGEGCCGMVTVRCWHCGEVLWRADNCSGEKMVRGKWMVRFEKTEGFAESIQAFVVGDRWRRESLDDRGRKERRCVAGKVGE